MTAKDMQRQLLYLQDRYENAKKTEKKAEQRVFFWAKKFSFLYQKDNAQYIKQLTNLRRKGKMP